MTVRPGAAGCWCGKARPRCVAGCACKCHQLAAMSKRLDTVTDVYCPACGAHEGERCRPYGDVPAGGDTHWVRRVSSDFRRALSS